MSENSINEDIKVDLEVENKQIMQITNWILDEFFKTIENCTRKHQSMNTPSYLFHHALDNAIWFLLRDRLTKNYINVGEESFEQIVEIVQLNAQDVLNDAKSAASLEFQRKAN